MKINHNKPNLNALSNAQALEQAARQAAKAKADETAKARAADETLRLQEQADILRVKKTGEDGNEGQRNKKNPRNLRYSSDGSVLSEDSEPTDNGTAPPRSGGIDLRA